ncbi:MAG TPA: glycine cleavage system aminomethyltransferase GcvT [Anaerolineae bacterium]|nr:glycine cleavage system aminomethyltransferase GcvT [Anaerolineae bacterium]
MPDFLFRGPLSEIDPDVNFLSNIEGERQYRKIILVPSESSSPIAVREALASPFQNIYAEGYPYRSSRKFSEEEILDYDLRLAEFRRFSDPRYYKGVEFADIAEELARRRCAEVFATNGLNADDLYVNVQALSGGPANNAVYHALVELGDTVMGMNLLVGGHLSHGSPVNRSGQYYNIVSYSVDKNTEQIDYDEVEALALEHKPKMIIAGVSSYPWKLDWEKFRAIADKVGAYLFADIAHVAGLVAAGVYPSPVGYADVITFTTHKTLCGPRGAIILTPHKTLARKLDRAVFPGEQGGPHVNVFTAMAVAFKLAKTPQFKALQKQILTNCKVFTDHLEKRGLSIAFGGTNTHLMNLNLRSITGEHGAWLTGDMAARILDIAGIVVNRNTIPGDKSARNPSGIRMGTPWVTQRGFKEKEMTVLADIIGDVLTATKPFYQGRKLRAKVDFDVLEQNKIKARNLALSAGIDFEPIQSHVGHYYYLDQTYKGDWITFDIRGVKVREYLNYVLSVSIDEMKSGDTQPTTINTPDGSIEGMLTVKDDFLFQLSVPASQGSLVAVWLTDISDGYIKIGEDISRKIPGPVAVVPSKDEPTEKQMGDKKDNPISKGYSKPYFIGIENRKGEPLPSFEYVEPEAKLQRTPLYNLHVELGAKMVTFAGWEMPVWYSSVVDEHLAVRNTAGLFDVAHMGVYQAEGPDAMTFLDSVCGNDISSLAVGESLYTHFLDPDANVIDDLLIYHRDKDKYLVVVNASNDDKDWKWLNAVREGKVLVDKVRPWSKAFGRGVVLRNLRDPKEGDDMRVDIALQGPRSRDILLALGADNEARKKILKLNRTNLCDAFVGGFDLIVSRTGYTGEKMAFELFVHPDKAKDLFEALLKAGEKYGLKPCGLGARDSLRTEAGLPLYGNEMGGDLNLSVADAGFGSYVKTYKPWFIGREAYLKKESERTGEVVRFRFNEKGVRMAHHGDPVVERRGKVIGVVTSCAVDKEGYLLGQAFVNKNFTDKDTEIYIFQGAPPKTNKSPAELHFGDRIILPSSATILSRFPKL